MFVKNATTVLHVKLPKTSDFATYALLSTFDLAIELPDKTVAYDNDITGYGSANYVTPVSATVDGEITFNFTPTTKGLHRITISTGTASNYTILGTLFANVIEPFTVATINTKLP